MTKVAIELMSMDSDPGYVPSGGWTEAVLVPAGAVADCAGEEEALWDLEGTPIRRNDLENVKVSTRRRGACNYTYHEGTFEVPEGMLVVQRQKIDVCTHDQVDYRAWVVDEDSLIELYKARVAKYENLVQDFLDRRAGFADLRAAVATPAPDVVEVRGGRCSLCGNQWYEMWDPGSETPTVPVGGCANMGCENYNPMLEE